MTALEIEILQNVIYHSCYYTLAQVYEAERALKLLQG
jgi:hypothetical protein